MRGTGRRPELSDAAAQSAFLTSKACAIFWADMGLAQRSCRILDHWTTFLPATGWLTCLACSGGPGALKPLADVARARGHRGEGGQIYEPGTTLPKVCFTAVLTLLWLAGMSDHSCPRQKLARCSLPAYTS